MNIIGREEKIIRWIGLEENNFNDSHFKKILEYMKNENTTLHYLYHKPGNNIDLGTKKLIRQILRENQKLPLGSLNRIEVFQKNVKKCKNFEKKMNSGQIKTIFCFLSM